MLKSELMELIANGENSGVEFKRDDIRPEQLAKEVVAMANLNGGHILLGVEDDGRVSGLVRKHVEEWVIDAVFGAKIHPMMIPFYEEVQVEPNKRVAVISFPQGVSKPYVVRDKGREDVYIRIGSTSRQATREQQARLFASGRILHTEVLPVAGATYSSLDEARVQDYLSNVIHDPDVPVSREDWMVRLIRLGFMIEGVDQTVVCTIAGLVLFGVSPRRYLRQAGIRLMVFDGIDKQDRALLDEVLDSPMVGLWHQDRGQRTLSRSGFGLIEQLIDKITPFISHEPTEIDEGFRRERVWHYPKDAVRELVINALAHRDWTRSVDIEIAVFSNRMEVKSPGALQNSMTIEKMLAGQRSPRNPLMVDVLRDYHYVDARGMGVRTKIVPLMKQCNQTEPVFELTDDYLNITLMRGVVEN